MKYITVKLTEDQIDYIIEELPREFSIHNPEELAFFKRLIIKLNKAKNL